MVLLTSAPLPIVLAGEWVVSEPHASGIGLAIDSRIFCEIESVSSDTIEINLPCSSPKILYYKYINHELLLESPEPDELPYCLKLIKFVIETALFFIEEPQNFKIKIWAENSPLLNFTDDELAIVGSASIIVAVHTAIRTFHGFPLADSVQKTELFNICQLTQFIFQEKRGSGINVAVAFHGGVIRYKTYFPDWIAAKLESNFQFDLLINSKWENRKVQSLPPIPDLHIALGLVAKRSNITSQTHSTRYFKDYNNPFHGALLSENTKLVDDLFDAWKKQDQQRIISDLQINQVYSQRLRSLLNSPPVHRELEKLTNIVNELDGAAQISRANFGIAITFREEILKQILQEWEKQGIHGELTSVDYQGLKIEKEKLGRFG